MFTGMNLVELRDVCFLPEVFNPLTRFSLPGFAFNGKEWFSIFNDNKVYFASVEFANETEPHSITFRVFQKMTVFEDLADKVISRISRHCPPFHVRPEGPHSHSLWKEVNQPGRAESLLIAPPKRLGAGFSDSVNTRR